SFNHPQGRKITACVAGRPGDCAIQSWRGGGELAGVQQRAGISGKDRVGMGAGVGIDAYHVGVDVCDDGHGGGPSFSQVKGTTVNGRCRPGDGSLRGSSVTSHVSPGRGTDNLLIRPSQWARPVPTSRT